MTDRTWVKKVLKALGLGLPKHFFNPCVVVMIVWYLDLQLPVQSVHITTKVVSLNTVHRKVYSMQNYVIKFVSNLRQVGGFLYQ